MPASLSKPNQWFKNLKKGQSNEEKSPNLEQHELPCSERIHILQGNRRDDRGDECAPHYLFIREKIKLF